jgi:hypothetical protein
MRHVGIEKANVGKHCSVGATTSTPGIGRGSGGCWVGRGGGEVEVLLGALGVSSRSCLFGVFLQVGHVVGLVESNSGSVELLKSGKTGPGFTSEPSDLG